MIESARVLLYIGERKMQFSVATDEFLQFCAVERRHSHHTIQAYTADLSDFRKWLPVEVALEEVSEANLKEYLANMVGERELASATIRRRFACLRAFFRRLSDLGHMPDPFALWRLRLPRRKRLPRALSRSEIVSLLGALKIEEGQLDNPKAVLPTSIRLIVSTGLRVGELCKLRINDVAPDGSSLRIHGKGSRDRVVYVTDAALRFELQRHAAQRREMNDVCDALFLNRLNLPIRPQSIRSKLRKYADNVGLTRRVTPHMLRHTAATLLIETGVDIRFVQRLLGHSSIATTEIYTHVSDEALRTMLERANVLGVLAPV
jgi:site-specific recombinase XerD